MAMEITNSYGNYGSSYVNNDGTTKTAQSAQNLQSVVTQSALRETEVAATYTTSQSNSISSGLKYLQELQKQYSNSYFGVGTVSYGQTAGKNSCVNFIVNPEYLSKLGTDEDAQKQFAEDVEYLYNYSQNRKAQKAASGWEVVSEGWFCDENGDWGGWIATRKTDEKSFLQKMQEKSDEIREAKLEKKREQEKLEEKKASQEDAEEALKAHFGDRFKGIRVTEESQSQTAADQDAKQASDETSGDEETESESLSGWVSFNEAKRARQLAAAASQSNIQSLMGLLQADLSQCESGKASGMCDDETIAKVNAMITKAQQKMGELTGKTGEDPAEEMAFMMAGLM